DNLAAFAFSGMGAKVTSVDISEQRLDVASKHAKQLDLPIKFLRADAADLSLIGDSEFDLVFSSNGFFVWIANLQAVFSEIYRILRPGGHYAFYDIHPFLRPWKDQTTPIEVAKPYWQTEPMEDEEGGAFEFHWTLADILNSLATSGLILRRVLESPAKDSRFWQDYSYLPGTDDSLLDWKENPRAALPVWLTLALQRPV
ncbi:MAG: class I SAM-dependent methyltransferase, partial [Chloroflexota bacterium]|nr:class I SAM-dependent methyltransferase [Chloroflexota bacterium]